MKLNEEIAIRIKSGLKGVETAVESRENKTAIFHELNSILLLDHAQVRYYI